jgi:hypothetical protein
MRLFILCLLLTLAACAPAQRAEVTKAQPVDTFRFLSLPAMKTFPNAPASPPTRSNTEIAADFMALEFNLESGRALPVLTRFDGPVTVMLTGDVPATAPADLGKLITRLRNEAGIDIAMGANAAITIEFLPRQRMQSAVPTAACFVAPRVSSWAEYRKNRNTGALDWATLTRREHLAIFVPSDTTPQEVRDCLHEELAQALGPLNDLYPLTDSVFNDDNFQAVLTGFDMLVLRLHNSPELQNGVTARDVAERLPALLAKLNPKGEFRAKHQYKPTSRPWINAIEAALGPNTPPAKRAKAAEQALAIAKAEGWADNRLAFSYFAVGRLNLGKNIPSAMAAFGQASRIYKALPDGPIHVAHVDMQVAALALSFGQPDITITLADTAMPVAMHAQNAALLATFMLLKAQALDQLGRVDEAQALRLDSLGWARYGFGSESDVRARMADIAALSPIEIGG